MMNKKIKYLLVFLVLLLGLGLRMQYLFTKVGPINQPDLGGDPCHHYLLAKSVLNGEGPKTPFVFSYWFHHPDVPTLTDVYPIGTPFVMAGVMSITDSGFLGARIASMTFGVLSIYLVFLIANSLLSFGPALFAALLVATNSVHIEHSAVVMSPVVVSFFILFAIFLYIKLLRRKPFAFILGVFTGLVNLFQTIGILFVAIFFVDRFVTEKFKFLKDKHTYLFFLGYAAALMPWGIYSYLYFGKPFYSSLSYWPFANEWGQALYESHPPIINLQKIIDVLIFSVSNYSRLLFSGVKLGAPIFGGAFLYSSSVTVMLCALYFFFKNKKNLWCYYLGFIYLVLQLIFVAASKSGGGQLYPRHYIPLNLISSILWGYVLYQLFSFFTEISFVRKISEKHKNIYLGCISILFIFVLFRSYSFVKNINDTFWMRDSKPLRDASEWINANLEPDARIIFGITPQDLACLSNRKVIVDPVYAGGEAYLDKAAKEIEFYKVNYAVIDNTQTVYERPRFDVAKMGNYYPGYNAKEIFRDSTGQVTVFKLIKNK